MKTKKIRVKSKNTVEIENLHWSKINKLDYNLEVTFRIPLPTRRVINYLSLLTKDRASKKFNEIFNNKYVAKSLTKKNIAKVLRGYEKFKEFRQGE